MKQFFLIICLSVFMPVLASENSDEFSGIINAFKNSSVTELQGHLGETVECDILGKSDMYSKAQAVQIMRNFFTQNKAKSFKALHRSEKSQTKYFIGSYITQSDKELRVTCFTKEVGGQLLIQLIRIEAN